MSLKYCCVSNSVIGCCLESFLPLERLLLANKTTNKYDIFGSCNYSCCAAVGLDQDLMRRKTITRRGWRGKKMMSAERSKLSGPQRSPKSSVWVTAADFHSASRCWSRDYLCIIISSSYTRRWFKMAQISLASELIVRINLFGTLRTTLHVSDYRCEI